MNKAAMTYSFEHFLHIQKNRGGVGTVVEVIPDKINEFE